MTQPHFAAPGERFVPHLRQSRRIVVPEVPVVDHEVTFPQTQRASKKGSDPLARDKISPLPKDYTASRTKGSDPFLDALSARAIID